jgi:L-ascorbate metabolism protein UlaG (beta-lactamase superfamily)
MSRWYRNGKPLLDEIERSQPQTSEVLIWFAGQHGFIINLGGIVFYIDVILNDLLDKDGLSRREYPAPFAPCEIQMVDYVLCTHNHIDHLNLETLLPLAKTNPGASFVVPAHCKRLLSEAGIDESRIFAARAGVAIRVSQNSAVSINPVPAIHTLYVQDDGEKDENGDYTSLGFVLKYEGISIYHSGDTWVTPSLIRALKAHSPIDIAMLPINGTDWERTKNNCIGNIGYLDAVKLAMELPVDLVLPSHFDMMAFNSENPARFAEAMYKLCPEKRYHIMALGERFIYRKE